ncbi:glycosyltransferase [Formosa sp. Hel1_33_131]|uniref:TIGR04282 family arsenosugar biosynthesis glycosyltransferase n=1 Tax=Formosa sp. Hel1_33_131 TaxID=1336794 RepID=UPI00084E141B|nr:TIGR04282 family arsenosugar biosynthesis glycosyltransferase [Formosa sp. Hel1_33_131]AOR27900.1 glycosyltransferase [Formosa sp. Hel1_33_131]
MNKNLILVFVRNPELGKVKTRLAKTIGDKDALKIYTILLQHTESVLHKVSSDKVVYYSEEIQSNDLWDNALYQKKLQKGADLGARMQNAFETAFKDTYEKVVIVGSDLFDLNPNHIKEAFTALENHEVVLGPSLDGGYYLLGMKKMNPTVFKNKQWGTDSVLESTLKNLNQQNVKLLEALNDIDTFEDLKAQPELLKKIKK